MDDIIKIVDDKRSSLEDLLEEEEDDFPELESQSDEENTPQVNWENMNMNPIPPPLGNPPLYAMSGQRAVQSKGVPKLAFHPYPCDHHPLAQLFKHAKIETGGLTGHPSSGRTTPTNPSYSSGGYRVVNSRLDGKDQCRSSGGGGSLLLSSSGGGNHLVSGEEGSESLFDSSGRTRAGQL